MAEIIIPIPDNFLDMMGEPWRTPTEVLGLREVLMLTLRRCPVQSGEDAERTLSILENVRDANGSIHLSEREFKWMIEHFKNNAFRIWAPPDAAYLVRHLECFKVSD